MRVAGPMLRPDAQNRGRKMSVSTREHFEEYERGRLAALRGEGLDAMPYVPCTLTNYWKNGWRAGTRQRLYREACMDAKTQQLMGLVAGFGWTQKETARALRIKPTALFLYLHGKKPCSRDVAERINTLYEEVKKAEAWLLELAEPAENLGPEGTGQHQAAGAAADTKEGIDAQP